MKCKDCKHEGQKCQEKMEKILYVSGLRRMVFCENFTPKTLTAPKGNPKTILEIGTLGLEFMLQTVLFDIASTNIIIREIKLSAEAEQDLQARVVFAKMLVDSCKDLTELKDRETNIIKLLSETKSREAK